MKIGNPADKPVVTPASAPSSTAATTSASSSASSAPGQPTEASAQVALSSTATSLLSAGDAEFNAGKVESVSQSIDRGEFTVNAEVIADKLIANAAELLSGGASRG